MTRPGLLDDRADVVLGAVAQLAERAVLRAVRGDLVLAQPGAVDEGEEVVLRTDGGVDPPQVQTGTVRGAHTSIVPWGTDGVRTDAVGAPDTRPSVTAR